MRCGSWQRERGKMADEIEPNAIDVEVFTEVEGSLTDRR
jgi:hypothetical protein